MKLTFAICAALVAMLGWRSHAAAQDSPPMIRVGIIGLDTSHAIAFTQELNGPQDAGAPPEYEGVRVVAAFPGGSADLPASADRVAGYTEQIEQMDVTIVGSVEELLPLVDAVMLESVDGRPHLEQSRPVFAAGKPLFIDKPIAASLADTLEIFRLSREHNTPCFSSSSLRFSPGIAGMKNDERVGSVLGCDAYGPCTLEPHHPDLFWYGIHGVETLYTIMGTGCQSVTRVQTEGTEFVTGVWEGGRVGTFRGIRAGQADYGALVFGEKGIAASGPYAGYRPLVVEIARFFKTKKPPVSQEETIELVAFMEAADESKRQGGAPVAIQTVMERARGGGR